MASLVTAGDRPPPGSQPLSAIAKQLEDRGYDPIVEMVMDDERWEVEAYVDGEPRELWVDPESGEILRDQPDRDDD